MLKNTNPALKMSKPRQQAYLERADPKDFFDTITLLAQLYAKKMYNPKVGHKPTSLLDDYEEYRKDEVNAW